MMVKDVTRQSLTNTIWGVGECVCGGSGNVCGGGGRGMCVCRVSYRILSFGSGRNSKVWC